ncbi:MAG: hypothetical protein WDW38_003206 [Sanguina aurantia]
MGDEPAALRTRSTRPKLPGLSDRLRVVRLEGDEDVDPLLVAFLRAQEAAAEAEAAVRLANKVPADAVIAVPSAREVQDHDDNQRAMSDRQAGTGHPQQGQLAVLHQISPYIRFQDASEDVKTGHQMLQYDAAEEDIEWLEELNRKGGTPKARLEKDLSLATFEVLTTAMENLHFDALQQSTKWCNEVKAGRVPVLTQAHVQLTRALAVSKLAQHDAAAVSCVYDRWLQLRRVSQGPLLQHLWFLQPWKAVAFADKSAGHEGELGDMPFVELEKQEGRGGWNRVLAMTSEEALEVLLDVRGELEALRTLTDQVRRRERLKKGLVVVFTQRMQMQIAPLRPVPAAHKPVPATHKAASTTHKAAATTHKASGSSTSPGRSKQPSKPKAARVHFEEPAAPSSPQPIHTAPLRPAHAPKRRKLSTEQACPEALDSLSTVAPASKAAAAGASAPGRHKAAQQAQGECPPESKASKGQEAADAAAEKSARYTQQQTEFCPPPLRLVHPTASRHHLMQAAADSVTATHPHINSTSPASHRRMRTASPSCIAGGGQHSPPYRSRTAITDSCDHSASDPQQPCTPAAEAAPAPSQASAARPNSRQQPASHSTQPPHPLGAHPPAASSGNSSREGTAAATGTHGRAVRPLRESSRASAVNGPACGTRKHAAPPPDEHPRTQRCAGDAEGAGQPSDAHSQARKGSQAQQLPIPHRGSSAARKSQNCPPAASADLPGARRQQHPVHDAHPLTRASNGRVAGAGALSPHLPPQHPVTAATATATAAVQDLHRHPAPATAKPHRSRSVQTGVPPTHTTGAHTANIASHPSHHSTDGHASDHPTATSGSRNHHPTTRSTAVHGNIHPTGASNKSQRSDMVRNKLGSPVQGVLTSPMKARGGSLASARHAVTKALLAARHGGQHSTRRLNHKQ